MLATPRYVDAPDLRRGLLKEGRYILAVAGFDAPRPAWLPADCPFAHVAMQPLVGSTAYEVWTCPEPAVWHSAEGIQFAVAGSILFGIMDNPAAPPEKLEPFAFDAYTRIFDLLERAGYPHVLRVFNYLPRIHAQEDGDERYRRFNAGRARAFAARGRATAAAPAACALGMPGGAPVIYFLASRDPGRPIENPRQISAYHYPPRYGAASPAFSRAIVAGDPPRLIISGTASIVGHETIHIGDAAAQTDETLRNLQALLSASGGPSLASVAASMHLKIYVRHRGDVPAVRARLAQIPPLAGAMFLQADICREDLLVEIEGFCERPGILVGGKAREHLVF